LLTDLVVIGYKYVGELGQLSTNPNNFELSERPEIVVRYLDFIGYTASLAHVTLWEPNLHEFPMCHSDWYLQGWLTLLFNIANGTEIIQKLHLDNYRAALYSIIVMALAGQLQTFLPKTLPRGRSELEKISDINKVNLILALKACQTCLDNLPSLEAMAYWQEEISHVRGFCQYHLVRLERWEEPGSSAEINSRKELYLSKISGILGNMSNILNDSAIQLIRKHLRDGLQKPEMIRSVENIGGTYLHWAFIYGFGRNYVI
jgi:hypothetical protein